MPEFVSPGDIDDEPTDNNSQQPAGDLPTVKIGDDEMPLGEGVNLMASMLENPSAFGIASDSDVRGIANDVHELQQAVSELARAIEMLSQGQAKLSEYDIEATTQLDDDALGDIYSATKFDREV